MENISKISSTDSVSLLKSLSVILESVSETNDRIKNLLASFNDNIVLDQNVEPLSDLLVSRLLLNYPDLFETESKIHGKESSNILISQLLSLCIASEDATISNWSLNSVLDLDFRPGKVSSYSFLKAYVDYVFSGYDHVLRAAGHGPDSYQCQSAHLNSRDWGTFR